MTNLDASQSRVVHEDYPHLLALDEGYLYCNLVEPSIWPLPLLADQHVAMAVAFLSLSAKQVVADRRRRMEAHQTAARDLRVLASNETDGEKRNKLTCAAELNEALAQTLGRLLLAALEDEPTAHEKRVACEAELAALRKERMLLGLHTSAAPQSGQLAPLESRIGNLEKERWLLLEAEHDASDRLMIEWEKLNAARRLLVEERGRERFRRLEPDSGTDCVPSGARAKS
jgi:hypothetical protein